MIPTPDTFRALARSSPWRWTTLHLIHRSGIVPAMAGGHVEAWLARPNAVRLIGVDGTPIPNSLGELGSDGRPTRPWRPPAPTLRPDGLVARRPGGGTWDDTTLCDEMFWNSYYWVAMLDPVELSHHVAVHDPRADEVSGRPVWRARLVAENGYQPRCGGNCCELVYSEAGLLADFADDPSRVPESWRGRHYPEGYDIALDVGTGVVVRCHPVGGDDGAPWLENDLLDVDADLDHLFA